MPAWFGLRILHSLLLKSSSTGRRPLHDLHVVVFGPTPPAPSDQSPPCEASGIARRCWARAILCSLLQLIARCGLGSRVHSRVLPLCVTAEEMSPRAAQELSFQGELNCVLLHLGCFVSAGWPWTGDECERSLFLLIRKEA